MSHKFFKGNVAGSDITSEISSTYIPKINSIRAADGDLTVDASANYQIKGVKNPSDDQDVVTKKYLDDSSFLTTSAASSVYLTSSSASSTYATQSFVSQQIEGIDPKELCIAASTGNLSGYTFNAGSLTKSGSSLTIDGVSLSADDRILLKDQSDKKENGIYTFATGGGNIILTRATDADSVDGIANAYTFVKDGTSNGGAGFVQSTLTSSQTLNTDDVEFTQFTSAATALTQEQVEDFAGALVASGGTKTGISVTYQDGTGDMDFVVSDLTVAGDSGSTGMTPGDTLTVKGGGDVTTAMSGDELTITCAKRTQEEIEDFIGAMVSGNTETNITVSYDDTNGKLDFAATDTNTQLSTEEVQDIAGPLVATGGTKTGISVTYDDSNNNMDFVVSDLTVAGDSGSTGMTPGDTLTVKGGGDVTTAMSGDELTVTCAKRTQEEIEDFVGAMVSSNTETGITVSYDDTNGKLDFAASLHTGNVSSFAVTSLSGTTDEITASASSGSVTLSLPDIKKVSIFNDGSDNFIDADVTIARATMKQVYCYTITDDRTLTLPQVGGANAPIGSRIEVKLLTLASGKKLSVAAYSGDKQDGSTGATELDVAGEQLNFTAVAASGDSTSTWIIS